MNDTTRVCRIHDRGDIRIETQPAPVPGPGQALVRVGAGGICGSDLHYYAHGGFGAIRLREPMILGHEVAGVVAALGPGVAGLSVGDRVALNPSHPCGVCEFCRAGAENQCLDMRFYGSAMRMPHVQGAFRDLIVAEAGNCVKVGADVPLSHAACAEPLAVCLHAVSRAPALEGRSVLITGAGPIGALTAAAAKLRGAAEIVVTDIQEAPLKIARRMGATHAFDTARDPEALAPWMEGKGRFDAAFECSAAAPALAAAIAGVRPGGTVVQLGIGGDTPAPLNVLVAKEISLTGSFRFGPEFEQAARLISEGAIDVSPILTGSYKLADARAAFDVASDRTRAVKVQLDFS